MPDNALAAFIAATRAVWGPLTSDLVASCREQLQRLAQASAAEPWLAALYRERPASEELYRDPDHGFVLQAHFETGGLYRPPHDHGRAWVIYAVQQGEIEMGTWGRLEQPLRLVKREADLVRAGEARVYLPGDIHDTRCQSPDALLFRFTDRDLRIEDRQEGRVTRYQERNGTWTL